MASQDMTNVPRCSKLKKDGTGCTRYAVKDSQPAACRLHLGKTVERARAEIRTAVAAARVFDQDIVPVTNPFLALADLAGELMAAKNALRDKVNQLTKLTYTAWDNEQIKAEVSLYRDLLGMTSKIVTDMARLNIDERLSRIDELQARAMLDAFEATLTELGLTAEVRATARVVMARRLSH